MRYRGWGVKNKNAKKGLVISIGTEPEFVNV
jgi:hypothetical protein